MTWKRQMPIAQDYGGLPAEILDIWGIFWNPNKISGGLFWSEGKIETRDKWNQEGYQLDNEADNSINRNLQCKTGGYFIGNSAGTHENNVSLTEQTLGDFSISFWAKNNGTLEPILGDANTANSGLYFVDSTTFRAVVNGSNYDFTTDTNTDFLHYLIKRDSGDLSIYVNGSYVDFDIVGTTNFVINNIGQVNSTFGDIDLKDLIVTTEPLSNTQILEIYNNPQKYADKGSDFGATIIADFNEGNGFDGEPVTNLADLAIPLTLQSGSTDNMIGNDAQVGSQQVLLSRNLYYWFDGVDDSILYTSESLANKTITLRLQYFDTAEYQVIQLSDSTNTDRFLAITLNHTSGVDFGISTWVGSTFTLQSSRFITTGSWNNAEMITIVITTDANGDVSGCTVNNVETTDDGVVSRSRANSGTPQNTFYIGARLGNAFAYKGIIDYFNFDDSIVSCNHLGFPSGTINGSPTIRFRNETTSSQDEYGNAIQVIQKQGTLNFTGLDLVDNIHGGVQCGNQIDVWDVVDGRVIAGSFTYNANGASQYIVTNKAGNDGFNVLILGSLDFAYVNEVGGSQTILSSITPVDGTTYKFVVVHIGTEADIYITDIDSDFPSTPTDSGTVGAIGGGSESCLFGIRPNSLTLSFGGLISIPQLYDKASIELSEIKTLAYYNQRLIQ